MSKRKKLTDEKKSKMPTLEEIRESVSGRTIRLDEQDFKFFNFLGDTFQLPMKDVIKKIINASVTNTDFLKEIEEKADFSSDKADYILQKVEKKIETEDMEELALKFGNNRSDYGNYIEDSFNYLMNKVEKSLKEEETTLTAIALMKIYPDKIRNTYNDFYSKISHYGNVNLCTLDIEFLTALAWLEDEQLFLTTLPYKEYPEIREKLQAEVNNFKESFFYFDQYVIGEYTFNIIEEQMDHYNIKSIYTYIQKMKNRIDEIPNIQVQDLVQCYKNTLNYSKKILFEM